MFSQIEMYYGCTSLSLTIYCQNEMIIFDSWLWTKGRVWWSKGEGELNSTDSRRLAANWKVNSYDKIFRLCVSEFYNADVEISGH